MQTNYTFFRRTGAILFFALAFAFTGPLRLQAQSTYTSTAAGGLWNVAATWAGGVVPPAGSHIVISGPVLLNGNFTVGNLTIQASGSVVNDTYWNSVLTVNGNLLNNGKVSNTTASAYVLYLWIGGNIENNGTWTVYQTYLSGNGDQRIRQSAGKAFRGYFNTTDTLGRIILDSDLRFEDNSWDMNKSTLVTNSHTLTMVNYALNSGKIQSDDLLSLQNCILNNMALSGSYRIGGLVKLRPDVVFNGTATLLDTLMNDLYWNSVLLVNGKIINEGKIITNPAGYSLSLRLLGDAVNHGVWAPSETRLASAADQRISQSAGKAFRGYFATADTLGKIILDSDVRFENNTWDMGKSTLVTNGHTLTTAGYTLYNGKIRSDDLLSLQNSLLNAITVSGSFRIGGTVKLKPEVAFNGTATLLDTLMNEWAWHPLLVVNGKIINQGKIINNPAGYTLRLQLMGDAENQGFWSPSETRFESAADQHISQTAGVSFRGYFLTTDTLGKIILDSDVRFENNTWDMGKSTVATNGHTLTTVDYTLNNGKIQSDDLLSLQNSLLNVMTLDGNYRMDGKVRIKPDVVFNGTATLLDTLMNENSWQPLLVVNGKIINQGKIINNQPDVVFNGTATLLDTLMNDWPWNPVLVINGKIVNQGKIINNPAGYTLNLRLLGDAVNNGVWAPAETRFWSTADQRISQSAGKAFRGYFATTDTLGKIILASDVRFENNTWDMSKSTVVTGQYSLSAGNCQLNNGNILSNGRLELQNTILYAMQLDGTYQLAGRVRFQPDNILNGKATVLDTLHNDTYWNSVLTVNGELINEGAIISHPSSGYPFYLNLNGNITNRGKWAPAITRFTGSADQTLAQLPGKWFEGKFITSDTLGRVVMASDIALSGNIWEMNRSKLLTNGFRLESDQFEFFGGTILSDDTLYLKNSFLADMTVNGDFVLGGRLMVRSNVLLAGNVTNLDSLHNQEYWNSNLAIQGNLVNEGVIGNLPGSGYQLTLSVSGSIENNLTLRPSYIYLTGTGDRTFGGRQAGTVTATVYADDNISLVGDNYLPNLNFTGSPSAFCTVKPGASLTLAGTASSDKISNYGRITTHRDIDDNMAASWSFYAADAATPAQTPLTRLTVDHYGYQQHPTATGTVNSWWRIRNAPALYTDSLNWLKLWYKEEALNGHPEDSLKVFHSPNAGLTWKRIQNGITVDKTNNTVTINKAPSYGHYLLSGTALGITSFRPLVERAEPRFGGNSGQLTMYIFGAGFKNSSTLSLKAGTTVIKADSTWVTDGMGESLQARFNLKNKPLGLYDVVVETPEEATISLPDWFTLENGERSQPWIGLTGRNRFLINRWQTFTLNYGNSANTDALGTILVFAVNDLPGLEVEFPNVNIVMAKAIEEIGPDFTRFRDSVDIYYVSDTLSGYENRPMRIYPLYIPVIPPGSSRSLRVRVRLNGPGSLVMDSWMLDPLYETIDWELKSGEPIPTEVRACITAAAMKAWYGSMVSLGSSVIPGLACWGVIDKTLNPVGHLTPESLKPEEEETLGSWLWKGVSIMGSAVQCGASFVPGLGTAVSLGISLVNTTIDIKDGYDATEGCWRKFRNKSRNKLNTNGVTSMDPNEKAGPQGYTADRYISREGNLNYTLFFENKKTAGAAALEVFVSDTLDVNQFDFSTFSFQAISFGDNTVKIQEFAKEFRILVDLYPAKDIILQVHGKLDTITGVVSWDFHSLDRITLELTEDPDLGFLPPNVSPPEGEGSVSYSCRLLPTVAHGDEIGSRASIVFDFNAPILTNRWLNTIDDRVPVSSVAPLPPIQTDSLFTVSWNGSDQGSHVARYHIFVSENDSAWVLWKSASLPGDALFKGRDGSSYTFYSVATDSIGFAEKMKTMPDASTRVELKTGTRPVGEAEAAVRVFPNPARNQCFIVFRQEKAAGVDLSLEDLSGKQLRTMTRQLLPAGEQAVPFDLSGLPDGFYMVKVSAGNAVFYRKLVIRN